MKHLASKTVWITGASSGIGRELALQLARQGHRIFISARNATLLNEMASTDADHLIPVPVDLTSEADVAQAAARIGKSTGHLDLVILNAGSCEYLDQGIIDSSLVKRIMDVNFLGSVHAAAAIMPLLEKSASPALYVVSSQVTALPITRSEAYGASKAALEYFFRTLRIDWQPRGIHVGVVRPGFVKTPLTDKNDFAMPGIWSADKAAAVIIKGIEKRALELSFPCSMTLTMAALALLPHSLWMKIGSRMVREHGSSL